MSIGEPLQNPDDGTWVVPTTITDGEGTVGFAWVPLTPAHPMYDEWRAYIQARSDDAWVSRVSGTTGEDRG